MSPFVNDLRQMTRRLTRRPAFVVLVVATLGIGIGASTTIFSVLDAVVLRPLPYPQPEELVYLYEMTPQVGDFAVSEPNFLDYRRLNQTFTDLTAFRSDELALVPTDGEPIRLPAARVTAPFFDLLGARTVAGRTFLPEEDVPGGDQSVVVLSHGLWQSSFGGDPDVVGTTIMLSDRPHEVVGVLEATFDLPEAVTVWVPLRPRADANRANHHLEWIGRMRPDVSHEAAQRDLAAIATRLGEMYPETNEGWGVRFTSLREAIVGPDLARRVVVLLGAVGLLLLIACANVSNLLLARGLERHSELAIRSAMGASRGHLLRQLVTESVALAVAGAGVGLLFAVWAIPLVQRLNPGGVARLDEAVLDARVFAFAAVLGVVCGMVFGILPAAKVLSGNVIDTLRTSGRRVSSGGRFRDALVVVELGLATTLLIGATLVGRSFVQLLDTDLGIDTERVVSVPVALTSARYEAEDRQAFFARLEESLRAIPGIEQVSATNIQPIGGGSTVMGIAVEGQAPVAPNSGPSADWRAVRPGIFETLGVTLLRGRGFQAGDLTSEERVVVISDRLARRLLPEEDPIGRRLALWEDRDRMATVVGVVSDLNDTRLDGQARATVYFADQGSWPWMTLLVRTQLDIGSLAEPLRQAIWRVDPTLPIPVMQTLDERKVAAAAPQRFTTALMSSFSVTAVILAAIGVYGLLSFVVASRARELGIRMALGARRNTVLRLVLGRAFRLTMGGIALGVVAALGLGRTLESLLFETASTDFGLIAAVSVALMAVAMLASALPAYRASRLSPTVALSSD